MHPGLIGATPEGRKELVGFTHGARESAQDWRDLLLNLKRRGLDVPPRLAIAKLPKSQQPKGQTCVAGDPGCRN